MTRVVRANGAGPAALAPPGPGPALQQVLRTALEDTGSRPAPGPLLVPLPAAGMSVVADVGHASVVGEHRFDRIALGTTDGALDREPDAEVLEAALRGELAARSDGPWPGGGAAPAGAAAPVLGPETPRDPVAAVDTALGVLRAGSGTPSSGKHPTLLTDSVLVRGLLPRVAAGEPGAETEQARLAALTGRLTTARDAEPPGPVRDLLDCWLTAGHVWFRPRLHPAPWLRRPNPLVPELPPVLADPPLPPRAGPFVLRPARPHGPDLYTVAGWMRRPEVIRFFGQPWPDARWARELATHGPGSGTAAVLADRADDPDAGPVGYLELYRPAAHALARSFPTTPDDLGVHVCVGAEHRRGTGAALLDAVATALAGADPACRRVLAEPDARNAAARGAFRRAGFTEAGRIALPHKDAAIMVRDVRRA